VSQLLQGLANGAHIGRTSGSVAPDHNHNGLPFEADGQLAVQNAGVIDHYHQGLPFTAIGRLVTVNNAAVVRVGNGAAPFDANDRLATGTGAISYVNCGVPYTAAGQIAVV
jgi:hypothetical protein